MGVQTGTATITTTGATAAIPTTGAVLHTATVPKAAVMATRAAVQGRREEDHPTGEDSEWGGLYVELKSYWNG